MLDCGNTLGWTGPTVERVLSKGKRVFALAFRRWFVEQVRRPASGHRDELGAIGQDQRPRSMVYLKDVLERLPSHPNRRIEELLPHR
jgi:hypothetical protein